MDHFKIIFLALLLGIPVHSAAQSRIPVRPVKNEFNLQIGGMSALGDGFRTRSWSSSSDLYEMYEPYCSYPSTSPVINLDYNHYVTNRFKVGLSTGFASAEAEMFNAVSGEKTGDRKEYWSDLMGQVKFVCLDVFNFKIHCGAAAGGAVKYGTVVSEGFISFKPAFEIIPFGIMWTDHRVYGIAETAFGTRMYGVRVGLGYRF